MATLFELRNASAGYAGRSVLHDIDLTIHAGERVAVMGRSGAGKSTLAQPALRALAERVALIPQAAALVKTLPVFHNVYMGRLDLHPTWHNLRTLVWPARRDVVEIEGVLNLRRSRRQALRQGRHALRRTAAAHVGRARALQRPADRHRRRAGVRARPRAGRRGARRARLRATRPRSSPCTTCRWRSPQTDRVVVLEDGRIVLDAPATDADHGRTRSVLRRMRPPWRVASLPSRSSATCPPAACSC